MNNFTHTRDMNASAHEIFLAISNPDRLKLWWGPKGFTNTFNVCDFRVGGFWSYVMHGPNGKTYPNESTFLEIETNRKITIQHDSLPKYTLVITLEPIHSAKKTRVIWSQTFQKSEVAKGIAHIVRPANEENLDRLMSEVLKSQ